MIKLLLLTVLLNSTSLAQNDNAAFEYLKQLRGIWHSAAEDTLMEVWELSSDSLMTGTGLIVSNGDTSVTEELQIYTGGGRVTYAARVYSQNNMRNILFEMKSFGGSVIFENAKHDFPSSINYNLNRDTLNVQISGTLNGSEKVYKFRFLKKE